MCLVVSLNKTVETPRFLYVCVGNIPEKYCFYPFEHYFVYLCTTRHIITTTLGFSSKNNENCRSIAWISEQTNHKMKT
jgi:hypothetical protein